MSDLKLMCETLVGLLSEIPGRKDASLEEQSQTPHSWTVKILDDLARILVCKDGETVAVGMQPDLGPEKGNIILTVASSGSDDPEAKADQLYGVLTRLQEIGLQFREYKREGVMDDDQLPSEKDLPDELQDELASLRECIYKFCVVKIWQLLRRDYTVKAREYLQQLLDDDDSDVVDGLEGVLQFLNGCYFLLNQNRSCLDKISGYPLETLAMGMYHGYRNSKKIFANDGWESELRENLFGGARVFPFEWFINQITAIAYSTERLIKFALNKKTFYRYLDPARRALAVRCLPNEDNQHTVSLPPISSMLSTSQTILIRLRKDIFGNPAIGSITPWTTLTEKHPKNEIPASVHPECRLALHFVRENRKQEFRAVGYIGTSTASTCLACWNFTRVLKARYGITFKMRGTHGRASFPWKFPDSELRDSGLCESVQEGVTDDFFCSLACAFSGRFCEAVERRVPAYSATSVPGTFAHEDEQDFELAAAKLQVAEAQKAKWCTSAEENSGDDDDDGAEYTSQLHLKTRIQFPVAGRSRRKVWRGRRVYSRNTCRSAYMRFQVFRGTEGWIDGV